MGGSASSGTPAAATLGAGCPGVMRAATVTPLHTSYTSPSDVCPWNTYVVFTKLILLKTKLRKNVH